MRCVPWSTTKQNEIWPTVIQYQTIESTMSANPPAGKAPTRRPTQQTNAKKACNELTLIGVTAIKACVIVYMVLTCGLGAPVPRRRKHRRRSLQPSFHHHEAHVTPEIGTSLLMIVLSLVMIARWRSRRPHRRIRHRRQIPGQIRRWSLCLQNDDRVWKDTWGTQDGNESTHILSPHTQALQAGPAHNALSEHRRGGAQEPGAPSQHRYWKMVHNPNCDTHEAQIYKAAKLIQATKLYNPPGDGLCFWYALAQARWPHNNTHYSKLCQALDAQRRTIAYVLQRLKDPLEKERILAVFRTAVDIGEDSSELALKQQLMQLTRHPQQYMTAANDVLRQECGHALQCQVHWWSVHTPANNDPLIDHAIWGEGHPVHLFYDHSALHYMCIMEFADSPAGPSQQLFQPIGAPLRTQDTEVEVQCAASWKVARDLGIEWEDCPWTARRGLITFHKLSLTNVGKGGWQEFKQRECTMTMEEADYWNATPLCDCAEQEPQAMRPRSQSPQSDLVGPASSQINGAKQPVTTAPVRRHKRKHVQLTLDDTAGEVKTHSCTQPHSPPVSRPRPKAIRPADPLPTWVDAAQEKVEENIVGTVGQVTDKLQTVCQQAPYHGRPLQVLTLNMRSSADMYKVHHLTYRLNDVPPNTDVIVTLQETWLRSEHARTSVRPVPVGPGWQAAALDRSMPDESRSGGIMTLVREGALAEDVHNKIHVRHHIIDTVGAMGTYVHRARNENGSRDATETTAIINVYVPTGRNKLGLERERQLTERVMGAARHAGEHNRRVILTGDWNHLTHEWTSRLRALGYHTEAQEGVAVIMIKSQVKALASNRCTEVCRRDSELFTDHPLLSTLLPPAGCTDSHSVDVRINTDLLAAHGEEYRTLLEEALVEHHSEVMQMTVTNRMRWAAGQMAQIGHTLTKQHTQPQGLKLMHFPKRIQKIHDKLRGKTPLGQGETKTGLRKHALRATARWHRRQYERTLTKRDAQYSTDMKRTFRQLTAPPRETMQVVEESDQAAQHHTADTRDDCARRRIGSLWGTRPEVDLSGIATHPDWHKYTQADPANTLAGIDAPVTEGEINRAFEKMGVGKATQSDHVSKEMLQQVPAEYKQMFVDYVQHTFETGHVDIEEGATDVVLLTKKPALSAQEITNKRPISLVKFVTKWVQTIIAHRASKQNYSIWTTTVSKSIAAPRRQYAKSQQYSRMPDSRASPHTCSR